MNKRAGVNWEVSPDEVDGRMIAGDKHCAQGNSSASAEVVDWGSPSLELPDTDQNSTLQCSVTLSTSDLQALDAPQMVYALCELKPTSAEAFPDRERLNLVLVVDCSTSMYGPRIGHVKTALLDLLEFLGDGDRLAVIAFNDRAEVVAESVPACEKRRLAAAISNLTTGGGTEIHGGLQAGLEQVRRYMHAYTRNHLVLLTDGRTYGDAELCLAEAQSAQTESVSISAFGIGDDWNDVFLDALAREGGGSCQFIDDPSLTGALLAQHIRGVVRSPVSEMSVTVDVPGWACLQAAFRAEPFLEILGLSPGKPFSLGGPNTGTLSLLFEFVVHQPKTGNWRFAHLGFAWKLGDRQMSLCRDLSVRTTTAGRTPVVVPARLLHVVSRLSVFRLQERAWQKVDSGDIAEASLLLESVSARFVEMGEYELAQTTMAEAQRLGRGIEPSRRGRKEVRYGTRFLPLH